MASPKSELRLRCPAHSRHVAPVRRALAAYLRALDYEPREVDDITTAAGEALANIVEHAYARSGSKIDRYMELRARRDARGELAVEVCDGGAFRARRRSSPGRGFGLRIMRAIAANMTIDARASGGTRVRMRFAAKR